MFSCVAGGPAAIPKWNRNSSGDGVARNTRRISKRKRKGMHTDYHNLTLKQLRDQQVRFAPREKKIEQVQRAEKLLGELDPGRTYSYEYLCYRITDFRPEAAPNATMSGDDAHHDLRLFVEDVSDAAN